MTIAFVGLNHKTAAVELREKTAFSAAEMPAALTALLHEPGVEEAVILSTCNRTEIYASINDRADGFDILSGFLCSNRGIPARDLMPHLYTADDLDAATHLFNVVCSLDSMVLGEQQILGQVRSAYRMATESDATGKVLNHLFHQALSVGKGVRSETEISRNHVSISTVAVDLAKRFFDDIGKRTVLVLGAGEMSELTARYLAEQNVGSVIVANRTYERALALATELGGRASRFDDIEESLALADIVISSTAAPGYVIKPDMLQRAAHHRRGRSLLLIDIAAPRDIDPACEDIDDVYLYSIDDLESIVRDNRAGREVAAVQAAGMVGDEVRQFADWLEVCDAAPTITELRGQADQIRDAELKRLFKHLGDVDDDERKSIEAMANAIVSKMLHKPIKAMRDGAGTPDGANRVRAVRDLFDMDESEE